MNNQFAAVHDHIAELRQTSDTIRLERRLNRLDGRPGGLIRLRLAIGRSLVAAGSALLGSASAGSPSVARR